MEEIQTLEKFKNLLEKVINNCHSIENMNDLLKLKSRNYINNLSKSVDNLLLIFGRDNPFNTKSQESSDETSDDESLVNEIFKPTKKTNYIERDDDIDSIENRFKSLGYNIDSDNDDLYGGSDDSNLVLCSNSDKESESSENSDNKVNPELNISSNQNKNKLGEIKSKELEEPSKKQEKSKSESSLQLEKEIDLLLNKKVDCSKIKLYDKKPKLKKLKNYLEYHANSY